MPIASPETYRAMLAAAKEGQYALPAINVTSTSTLNAALMGFAEAESDGIIQVSTGGAEFFSGMAVKKMPVGGQAMAEAAYVLAAEHDVNIALHTDHCQPNKVDSFIRPLLAMSRERKAAGLPPLFQSHMLDASSIPLEDNLALARELLDECHELDIILEIEIGIVGGVEDTEDNEDVDRDKLYTSPEDMVRTSEVLGQFDRGTYMLAAVFGNVHGVYKPGAVELRPTILRDGQAAVAEAYGEDARHKLVFHGGSGSTLEEIRETLGYGVIKMNIDTDCQYAYTRPVAGHMFENYDGVLKVDGDVGDKGVYDPRVWSRKAERGMADRVIQACEMLKSTGHTLR